MAAWLQVCVSMLTFGLIFRGSEVFAAARSKQRGSSPCTSKDNGRTQSGFRYEACSSIGDLKGEHAIDRVRNFCFSQSVQDDLVAVRFQWNPSPLGIEYIRGFKIILQEAKAVGAERLCQALVLEERKQLKYFNKTLVLKSHPFRSLKLKTQYNVTILPFPNLVEENNTFQFEVEHWSPKNLDVNQLYQSTNLNVTFDLAPSLFGFKSYHIRCKMVNTGFHKDKNIFVDNNMTVVSYVFHDLYPGTYTIEVTDSSNTTGKQINFTVRPVHYLWAGPIRAIAITVPLVIVSAIITLLTVLCCKKQQNPVYSELDEENSESLPIPRSKPKVFICYSSKDCQKHLSVVQCFAFFLQDFCGCEVALDLWEHLEICKEGQMDWLSRQIMESHYIIVICSKGMKFFVEKKHRKHKGSFRDGGQGELFIVAVSMIAERLRQARLNSGNPSKFIAIYFDYSCEADIPGILDLACKYKLMDHFPQLYSHLHARDHSHPDRDPREVNIRKSNYFRTKSGRSLYIAISNMKQLIELEPDWFEKQLLPGLPRLSHHQGPVRVDSGLVLNEVVFKQPVTEHDFHLKTIADVTPINSVSYSIIQHLSIIGDADVSDRQDASSLLRPLPRMVASVNLPEMPRDSGIYDSSIPSSELSLPLMDGLSSDQTETGSIADSVSSSSGLGEDEPPGLTRKSSISEPCKVEIDRHIHTAVTL
ncbi:interleukin-17 receptor D isoform X1 [Scyliorhinus canicula]|uniref:interleukin-17 receptor D isoform X1 n=1 Tax=Scyliorhinus canicula TaxID=7830 RepID=UPI0018F28DD8|nr:interleukin-17 receptor D isoform X1 [Scyliorhinus canicula]